MPKCQKNVDYFLEACRKLGVNKVCSVACEQADIWEHTRERQRANSKPERSFREESGDEGRRK